MISNFSIIRGKVSYTTSISIPMMIIHNIKTIKQAHVMEKKMGAQDIDDNINKS